MTIPDEAVQAAYSAYVEFIEEGGSVPVIDAIRAALTAAAPFLQGVKVKALEWVGKTEIKAKAIIGTYLIDQFAEKFRLYSLDRSSYQWFDTLEAAKSAAQADYEARILSAIEVTALAPSPRAQALDEVCKLVERRINMVPSDTKAFRAYQDACRHILVDIRALSSQPVADGWLPIETAPNNQAIMVHYDDGNIEIISADDNDYSWIAYTFKEDFVTKTTHWRPLPASPGASE